MAPEPQNGRQRSRAWTTSSPKTAATSTSIRPRHWTQQAGLPGRAQPLPVPERRGPAGRHTSIRAPIDPANADLPRRQPCGFLTKSQADQLRQRRLRARCTPTTPTRVCSSAPPASRPARRPKTRHGQPGRAVHGRRRPGILRDRRILVPRDRNGDIIDVYEYVGGRPQLITPGGGPATSPAAPKSSSIAGIPAAHRPRVGQPRRQRRLLLHLRDARHRRTTTASSSSSTTPARAAASPTAQPIRTLRRRRRVPRRRQLAPPPAVDRHRRRARPGGNVRAGRRTRRSAKKKSTRKSKSARGAAAKKKARRGSARTARTEAQGSTRARSKRTRTATRGGRGEPGTNTAMQRHADRDRQRTPAGLRLRLPPWRSCLGRRFGAARGCRARTRLDQFEVTLRARPRPAATRTSLSIKVATERRIECEPKLRMRVHRVRQIRPPLADGLHRQPARRAEMRLADFSAGNCPADSQIGICHSLSEAVFVIGAAIQHGDQPRTGGLARLHRRRFISAPDLLDLTGRTESDYGLDAITAPLVPLSLPHSGARLWGVPADPKITSTRFATPLTGCRRLLRRLQRPRRHGCPPGTPFRQLDLRRTRLPGTPSCRTRPPAASAHMSAEVEYYQATNSRPKPRGRQRPAATRPASTRA